MNIFCKCNSPEAPYTCFEREYLGMDDQEGRFGDVTLLVCSSCNAIWLSYSYSIEGISGSGKWWRGKIPKEKVAEITIYNALRILEKLPWYYMGGSYFGGETSRVSGEINEATPKQNEIPGRRENPPDNNGSFGNEKNDQEADDDIDMYFPF